MIGDTTTHPDVEQLDSAIRKLDGVKLNALAEKLCKDNMGSKLAGLLNFLDNARKEKDLVGKDYKLAQKRITDLNWDGEK